ncbi:hypothetical protein E4U40_006640 [Claviceps sp. LM458 group G5]|nr:hypothetical protein E4U40_006640 [Claviceps sp. LM458 group G5]
MRISAIVVAAFAGIAVAKRGCRHDHRQDPKHKGMGWYYVVEGDDLDPVAADFGDTADAIAQRNGLKDKNFVPAGMTIYVKCP